MACEPPELGPLSLLGQGQAQACSKEHVAKEHVEQLVQTKSAFRCWPRSCPDRRVATGRA
eukprot:2006764-Alexandrium_andersonii.AAC.1